MAKRRHKAQMPSRGLSQDRNAAVSTTVTLEAQIKNCTQESKNSLIPLRDQQVSLRLHNSQKIAVEVVRVDGCVRHFDAQPKCDFIVGFTALGINHCWFIELKGSDVAHACTQLDNTIKQVKPLKTGFTLRAYIVCDSYPKANTRVQGSKLKFMRDYRCQLATLKNGSEIPIA